jgi:S1-C subfamily serine protease
VFRRLRYFLEMRGSHRSMGAPAPAERPWVHPSELPGSFEEAAMPPVRSTGSRRFQVLVGTAAAALLLTGGVFLAAPSASQPAGASVGPRIATSLSAVPSPDGPAANSLLALVIYEGQHLGTATALVLPPGDLAVTSTPIPAGSSVVGVRVGKRAVPLNVVGTDRLLGVTVLRLPSSEPITPTASLAAAVSTDGAPLTLTALAAVRGVVTPMQFEFAAAYLSSSEAATTVGHSQIAVTRGTSVVGDIAGTVILNGQGRAVAASVPALGATAFVPATFLELLAQRIVLGDTAGHGWLQLEGTATPTGGARVVAVTYRGAAWGAVRPGDTIVAVNSIQVRTMADIGSILYTSSPGQILVLTLVHDGHLRAVDVTLAASP